MFIYSLLVSTFFALSLHSVQFPEQSQPKDPCEQIRIELATTTMQKQTLEHKLKQIEAANAEALTVLQLQKELKQLQTNLKLAEKSLRDEFVENQSLRDRIIDLEEELRKQSQSESETAPSSPSTLSVIVPRPEPTKIRAGWKVVKETLIDGTIDKVEHGTLLKTIEGDVFEVSEFVIEIIIVINPEVTVITDGIEYKLIIDGVDRVLVCNRIRGDGIGVGAYFESKIDGNFEGFEFGKLYKLQNGQIWEQTSSKMSARYRFAPTVYVWQSGSRWKMRIDDDDRTVDVKQVK